MRLLWLEVKRFFNKYKKSIMIVPILLTVLFTGIYLLTYDNTSAENEETGSVYDPDLHDGNAYFKFYIEDENQQPFTNTVILNQYIRLDETLLSISEQTNTDLFESYKEQEVNLLLEPLETIPVIEIRRDSSSHMLTFYARLEDEDANLRIANYVFEQFANKTVPFLMNKDLYIFSEPRVFNNPVEPTPQDVFSVLSARSLVLIVVVILVFSIILTILFNLGGELFSKKLNFSFAYSTNESAEFYLYSKEMDNEYETTKFLSAPGFTNKLIISQSTLSDFIKMTEQSSEDNLVIDTTKLHVHNQLENIEGLDKITEIILVVLAGETDRNWYNEQRRIASLYRKPVKVLQINS